MFCLSVFKIFIRNKIPRKFHCSQQIIVYSTNTNPNPNPNPNPNTNTSELNKKILEIINSIKDTYNFKIAFIHKSVRLTELDNKSYERLEFLGDSLIEHYTSHFL